jgi:putative DNA primase/helicase
MMRAGMFSIMTAFPQELSATGAAAFPRLGGRTLAAGYPRKREAAHRVRVEAIRREREAEDAMRKVEARENAAAIWQAAGTAPEDHPYLVKKGIKTHGLRVHDGALVIPMCDGPELHSLQFIGPEGDKRFLSGGRVSGCYLPIGKPGGTLCIAEGYATAASIHEATGLRRHPAG